LSQVGGITPRYFSQEAVSIAILLEGSRLVILLEAFGHEAFVAMGRAGRIEAGCGDRPIDVALLDIDLLVLTRYMPGMDGLNLARELRAEIGDDVVLVAVTGYSADHPRVSETFFFVPPLHESPLVGAPAARVPDQSKCAPQLKPNDRTVRLHQQSANGRFCMSPVAG
jgi:CheY-like chemotaxis protein